ncbi:MAG: ABC transporter permease subunit [Oscillospiraceae bacterium]|nr:ABC transporter permease subunit [Oscillospiraceae bacterium]
MSVKYARTDSSLYGGRFFTPKRITGIKMFLLVLPLLCLVAVFSYAPLFGWLIAFCDYKPGRPFLQQNYNVGFRYFQMMFSGVGYFPTVMRNTLVLSLMGIVTSPIPIILAIMTTRIAQVFSKRVSRVIQTFTALPNFISWVLVYSLFFALFNTNNGAVNSILKSLGLIEQPTNILINVDWAWVFQIGVGVWKGAGWSAIIYFAAISGIDQELYDAADVDGASSFQKTMHVTVPGILPTYYVLLLLGIANMLSNGFDQYFIFQNARTVSRLEVLDTYIYKIGLAQLQFSMSTAMGMFKSVVSITLLTIANVSSKLIRGDSIF